MQALLLVFLPFSRRWPGPSPIPMHVGTQRALVQPAETDLRCLPASAGMGLGPGRRRENGDKSLRERGLARPLHHPSGGPPPPFAAAHRGGVFCSHITNLSATTKFAIRLTTQGSLFRTMR